MFSSISEGLVVYEARLKAYVSWTERVKKGGRFTRCSRIDMATEEIWRGWLDGFRAMELVLGFTTEEAVEYRRKHGAHFSLPEWMNAIRN